MTQSGIQFKISRAQKLLSRLIVTTPNTHYERKLWKFSILINSLSYHHFQDHQWGLHIKKL